MERWIRLLATLYFVSFANVAQQTNMAISTVGDTEIFERIQRYLVKSYSRLGYNVHFLDMAPGRAVVIANEGTIDGVSARVTDIEQKYENLIRVPVVMVQGDLTLYCAEDVVCEQSVINDRASIIGGIANAVSMLQYMKGKNASLYLVTTPVQLTELFERKRLSYILSIELDNLGNFQNFNKKYKKILLTRVEAYHYLNKKHESLVPELVESLHQTIEEFGPINQTHQ